MSTEIKLHHGAINIFKDIEIWDTRFINSCLLGEDQSTTFGKGQYYAVDIGHYATVCRLTRRQAHKEVLKIARKLMGVEVKVFLNDKSTLYTHIIHAVKDDEETGYILIQWNQDFIPYISGQMVKGHFLMADSRMDSVSTNKRYGLYILIQKNLWKLRDAEVFYLTKQELRDAVGLEDTQYSEFKYFNSNFLKPTLSAMEIRLGIGLEAKVRGDKVGFTHAV